MGAVLLHLGAVGVEEALEGEGPVSVVPGMENSLYTRILTNYIGLSSHVEPLNSLFVLIGNDLVECHFSTK